MIKNKKAFTIVELVIVIAVIAVLAAVLIPTFSGVVDKANESAALQEVQNAYINALADALGAELKDTTVEADGFKFTFSDSTGQNATIVGPNGFNYSAKVENGVVVLGPATDGNEGGETGGGAGGDNNTSVTGVTGVTLDLTDATLNVGGTVTLTATVAPTNATNKNVTWSTSAPTVATVDNGVVTAKAEGVAVIIVATEDGDKMATCTVTVNGSGANNEAPTGTAVGTEEALRNALNAGGDCQLTANIELATAVNIPAGKTSTINLNGHTLTLEDPSGEVSDVISVSGNLTITGGNINIANTENQTAYSNNCGISVAAGGTLNLNGVKIDGNREWNIENDGTVSLTGVNFTVNDGFGLTNYGTATITGGSFVANGTETTQIYNVGGTMRITKTAFSEGNNFSSYGNRDAAPIHANGGAITLNGVTVTTKTAPSVYAGYENNTAQVTIESGSFNSNFTCLTGSSVTVKGGTFSDKTFAELYAAGDDAVKEALCCYDGWTVTRADNVITLTRN